MSKPIIICVDDEKIIVDSLKSEIKASFKEQLNVETAESGREALELIGEYISKNIDIPIVISDWLMPEMKGDEVLCQVHKLLPETMKILLTGQVTTTGLGNAINEAKLYRFIPKPWYPEDLDLTLTEAFKSYYNKLQLKNANAKLSDINTLLEEKIRIRTAELEESYKQNQILLDQTLFGSINALIKILMKSNPSIFNKAYRIRTYAKSILKNMNIKNIWEIEIASLFSQVGCLYLPESLLARLSNGEKLSQQEVDIFRLHPLKTYELISSIPIFGNIAEGILNHLKPASQLNDDDAFYISAILRLASDLDDLIQLGKTKTESVTIIKKNIGHYDYDVLNALIRDVCIDDLNFEKILKLPLNELVIGYVLAEDVVDLFNNRIFSAELEITAQLLNELTRISKIKKIKEPIYVYNYLLV
jgi:response regulator RpfG family c-di-GMP phosphodiesterase